MTTEPDPPITVVRHAVSEDREAQLFWRMRFRIARACLRDIYSSARLRTTLIVALSLLFWSGLFVLFHQAFHFVKHQIGGAGDPYQRKHSNWFSTSFSPPSM